MMKIIMYSADWCSDCVSAKKFLDDQGVTYKYIDINNNPEAIEFVKQINNGKRIIPTFVVDDKTYTNPGISKLSEIIRE